MNFETALMLLPGLIIGLTVHEAAHAISAKWLGDRNPERMGRISLNPFRHLSPMGTLVLFFIGFGWGKPVEVNLYNFKKPKLYYLLTSLAGPASNLIICAIILGVMRLPLSDFWRWNVCFGICVINTILAVVNLLPIPPLDGSKIWPCLIPGMRPSISGKWMMVWVVVLIVSMKMGLIGKILDPLSNIGMKFMPVPKTVVLTVPDDYPEIIIAPENAGLAGYMTYPKDGSDPNRFHTRFGRVEQYPAESTLGFLRGRLLDGGWRRLDYLFSDPNVPGATKWNVQEDIEEQIKVYDWSEDWINGEGDVVLLNLEYKGKLDSEKGGKYLTGELWFLEPSSTRLRMKTYKRLHPTEISE